MEEGTVGKVKMRVPRALLWLDLHVPRWCLERVVVLWGLWNGMTIRLQGTEEDLGGQRQCGLESPAVFGCWVNRVGTKGCCGERTWESSWVPRGGILFCSQQSDRATETPALAPNKQILLVLLEEPSWVWGPSQKGGKESTRKD